MPDYSVLQAPWENFTSEAGGFQWLNSISEFIPSDCVQRIREALDSEVVSEFSESDLETLTQLTPDKIHHMGLPAFLAWVGEADESTLRILAKLGDLPAEVIDAVDGVLDAQAPDDMSSVDHGEGEEDEDSEDDEDAPEADEPQTDPIVNSSNVQPPITPAPQASIPTPNKAPVPPKKG